MAKVRHFQLDELTLRPGMYFNPETEIMIVVDDSLEIDHEIFEAEDRDGADWVLIADDAPVDEHKRDELVERFQLTHQPSGEHLSDDDDDLDLDDEGLEDDELDDEDDELDDLDDLELGHEHDE